MRATCSSRHSRAGSFMPSARIVQMMTETSARSSSLYYAFLNMLSFGGLISVNLGIMNLLPIPALDGGRSVAHRTGNAQARA